MAILLHPHGHVLKSLRVRSTRPTQTTSGVCLSHGPHTSPTGLMLLRRLLRTRQSLSRQWQPRRGIVARLATFSSHARAGDQEQSPASDPSPTANSTSTGASSSSSSLYEELFAARPNNVDSTSPSTMTSQRTKPSTRARSIAGTMRPRASLSRNKIWDSIQLSEELEKEQETADRKPSPVPAPALAPAVPSSSRWGAQYLQKSLATETGIEQQQKLDNKIRRPFPLNTDVDEDETLRKWLPQDVGYTLRHSAITHQSQPRQSSTAPMSQSTTQSLSPSGPINISRSTSFADEPVVMILFSTSKSLLESDLYRLARQGQHVDGWAGGITKIVQSRNPVTQEPVGQYFIFFDSRAAALAYSEELRRLHGLSRKALPEGWQKSPETAIPSPMISELGAIPGGKGDVQAELKRYAIHPPSAGLSFQICSAQEIRDLVLEPQTRQLYTPQKELPKRTKEVEVPAPLQEFMDNQYALTEGDHNKVLVKLSGSKMTPRAIRGVIEEDGYERNLAWQISNNGGVLPVLSSGSKIRYSVMNDGKEEETDGFARFIVSFAEPVEARRFVRSWHKRLIQDPRTERDVTVDVTALW
ncbi:hypothetical protein QBC46DRAFT_376335 [Diplogelasinospora grovesii]|uniref:Uncharacterized protein n=1 Tax=Diplogelasinospora grovesii TaxID=303347 RepID=A0AAN6S801_9PEZI|nr:hypothetical protein QBC46DRAFT_376335 [Diplogelasinospora grovesii]